MPTNRSLYYLNHHHLNHHTYYQLAHPENLDVNENYIFIIEKAVEFIKNFV